MEGTGLTDPFQPAAGTGQNILFIAEPEPSSNIPPPPQVAPPAPGQDVQPEAEEPVIYEPLAEELTSKNL